MIRNYWLTICLVMGVGALLRGLWLLILDALNKGK